MARKQPEPEKTLEEWIQQASIMMADLNELYGPVREAVVGYKKSYMDNGFSEEAAEACAVQYHAALMMHFERAGQNEQG